MEIIKVIRDTVSRDTRQEMARQQFGDMVKAVVDVKQGIMAIGGELHSDEEAILLDHGSLQENLWGSTCIWKSRLKSGLGSMR